MRLLLCVNVVLISLRRLNSCSYPSDIGLVTPYGIFAFGGVILLLHVTLALFIHRKRMRQHFATDETVSKNIGVSLDICLRMFVFCVAYFGLGEESFSLCTVYCVSALPASELTSLRSFASH